MRLPATLVQRLTRLQAEEFEGRQTARTYLVIEAIDKLLTSRGY